MKRHAVRGALWLIPAKAISAGFQFVGIFILARYYLDRYEVGLAALVLAVTGLLAAGADLGMGVLNVSRERADDRQAARWAGLSPMLASEAVRAASSARRTLTSWRRRR